MRMSNLELSNHFLIAMPDMMDPNFSGTLSVICEYSDQGSMGFIINRPTVLELDELFRQQGVQFDPDNLPALQPIFFGGPVQPDQGFVLHTAEREWQTTMKVGTNLSVTASRDIIEDVAAGKGPEKYIFLLGYAGWGPGQLETEITENAWLTCEADNAIIFDLPPEERWQQAAAKMGIDLNLISTHAGHA
jgi:putative transcriptional regulator